MDLSLHTADSICMLNVEMRKLGLARKQLQPQYTARGGWLRLISDARAEYRSTRLTQVIQYVVHAIQLQTYTATV